jgi:hypothetical protein
MLIIRGAAIMKVDTAENRDDRLHAVEKALIAFIRAAQENGWLKGYIPNMEVIGEGGLEEKINSGEGIYFSFKDHSGVEGVRCIFMDMSPKE